MARGDLRLADLRGHNKASSKLMNVKIPGDLSDAIDRIVQDLGVTKTTVIVVLLNEGLDRFLECFPELGARLPQRATAEPSSGTDEK